MNNVFTYQIGDNLYLNLTNRCSNRCTFCVREGETYEGYPLWLSREPEVFEVEAEIGDPKRYREIVFCGYGEPTYRLGEMLEIADYVHARGGKTRLNTNGHASLIHGKDVAPLFAGKLDGVNISLNAGSSAAYDSLCRPLLDGAYDAMISFARRLKECGVNCWFSAVDVVGEEELSRCRAVAEEVGIPLRVREYIEK